MNIGHVVPQGIAPSQADRRDHRGSEQRPARSDARGVPGSAGTDCRDRRRGSKPRPQRSRRWRRKPIQRGGCRRCRASGRMTALAVEAFAPPMDELHSAVATLRPGSASCHARLLRRQGAARADFEGRPGRHPPAADHRRDVAAELAGPQSRSRKAHGWRGCWRASRGCWSRSRWPTRWRGRSGPC